MTFRYARHTHDLVKIEAFYTNITGLEKLGAFKNHAGYDGIFLGYHSQDWHLEFTSSDHAPASKFDEDDALVFYLSSEIELAEIKKTLQKHGIAPEQPRNPYWLENGLMISDPDGYKLIFSVQHVALNSEDPLTALAREKQVLNWGQLLDYTRHLPYGRNQNREDLSLVLTEGKGTCSSKHALLKKIADLNQVKNIKLILGIYRMDHVNTPKIGNTILESGLQYIPEAHCYLKINNTRFDLMSPNSDIHQLQNDILTEIEIAPEQVSTFKVELHKNYLRNWISEQAIPADFDTVWATREACIKKLGE